MSGLPYGGGGALGIVIVSRQRTSRDGEATLKFNCGQDDLVKRLVDRCNTLSTLSILYLHLNYTLSTQHLLSIYTLSTNAIYRYDILGDVKGEAVTVRLEQETDILQRSAVLSSLQEAVRCSGYCH